MVVTGPVGKHFGNLESYPVHNQIHGLVLIESKSLVIYIIITRRTLTLFMSSSSRHVSLV